MYSISSDLPHVNCDIWEPTFETFFMSLKDRSLVQRSGNSSKRESAKTTVSAFLALFTAPKALSSITTFSGAAVVARLARR